MYSEEKKSQILFTLLVHSNCLIYYKIYLLLLLALLLGLFCTREYLKVSASRCLKLKIEGQNHSHCLPPKIKKQKS